MIGILGAGLLGGVLISNLPQRKNIIQEHIGNALNLFKKDPTTDLGLSSKALNIPEREQGTLLRGLHRHYSNLESRLIKSVTGKKVSGLNILQRFGNWISATEYSEKEWSRINKNLGTYAKGKIPFYMKHTNAIMNSANTLSKHRKVAILRRTGALTAGIVGMGMLGHSIFRRDME